MNAVTPVAPRLADLCDLFQSIEQPAGRITRALEMLERIVPYDRCALHDAYASVAEVIVVPEPSVEERAALKAKLSNLHQLVSDHPRESARVELPPHRGSTQLAVPLTALDEAVGVLLVERTEGAYDETHLQVLSIVAAQLAAYLANVRLRREEQESLRATQELERLLFGIVGHDLRSPLGAINLAAHRLRTRPGMPEAAMDAIDRIEQSGSRMTEMITQLLDITKVRLKHELPIVRRDADMAAICHKVVDELLEAHPASRIDLSVSGDLRGQWDAERISQLLSNLVSNAIQHGDPESPVDVRASEGPGSTVVVAVHNQGPPIPPEVLPFIFQPLRQGLAQSGEPSRKAGSLGLGLYIAQHIAAAHRAKLEVESTAESGTTFILRIAR